MGLLRFFVDILFIFFFGYDKIYSENIFEEYFGMI